MENKTTPSPSPSQTQGANPTKREEVQKESKFIKGAKTTFNFAKSGLKLGMTDIGYFIGVETQVGKTHFALHLLILVFLLFSFGWILLEVLISFILGNYVNMGFQILGIYLYKKYIIDKYYNFIKTEQNKF